jgi:serine/threonine protein kinase
MERPADPYLGRTLGGRYSLDELIGIGGMGRVYRGTHLGLDRPVAIKLINPKHLDNQAAAARFMVEARAVSRLNHPNVVAIHDFGGGGAADGPELYLVMELLNGVSLGTVLLEGPMPIPRVTDILSQILAALHEAHRNGVIHRDIKPENVIVDAIRPGVDRVKVIDFGVAKLHASTQLTQFGEVVGTPRYMAPEQASGRPASPATDIYAVGVLMFEMLTGHRLFEGRGTLEVVAQILAPERPDPRVIAPERAIPAALAQLCMRAISVDPAVRPASAEAFARLLLEATGSAWSPKHSLLFVAATPLRSGASPTSSRALRRDDATTEMKTPRRKPSITPTPTSTPMPRSSRPASSGPLSADPRSSPPVSSRPASSGPVVSPPIVSSPIVSSPRVPPSIRSTPIAPPLHELDALHDPTIPMKRALPQREPEPASGSGGGEDEGTIDRLAEEFQAARHAVLGGDHEAAHAWVPAGQQLAAALVEAGRVDEAYGVLSETLEHTEPATVERALVSEQMAYVAARRGRADEARALLQKALEIAEAQRDEPLASRLRRLKDARGSGVRASAPEESALAARRKTGGGHRGR